VSARLVFAGTPDFALASLKALVESGRTPVAVYTQPDRPSGRGKKLTPSPVKVFAEAHDIEILQPSSMKDEAARAVLRSLSPDVLIVAAYGHILPKAILEVPSAACVNVHASLLPRWRGAAPIQAAIRDGDAQTGISLMAMTPGLDEGPVYARSTIDIGERETAGELHDRLATLGGELLVRHLDDIASGELDAVEQDDDLATYAPKFTAADAKLDWQLPAGVLERRVRAFNPVPGCWFRLDDDRVKVWSASVDAAVDAPAGTVVKSSAGELVVACGQGGLRLQTLQRPGKGRVDARQFIDAVDLSGRRLDG